MENQVVLSGTFNREQANLVENSNVQPNYTSDLIALAQQIQNADKSVQSNVTNKLNIIIEQIQFLQEQARGILEKAKLEKELHQAACNILKRPGTVYYYYKRDSGQKYLTIMSPSDWGKTCPHEFLGAYRLEYDNSWVPIDQLKQVDERKAIIQQVMSRPAIASIKDVL
ncbi:unnamed protein product [Brachionus calyciflorus]|uniref:DUF2452 domain-containing protein n=1 Tax=Brachionus calyciflorus TaxID=104777 RepID=A0A813S520_9BILA|nr:unnamed protein product [Brachionus calyciflorus]